MTDTSMGCVAFGFDPPPPPPDERIARALERCADALERCANAIEEYCLIGRSEEYVHGVSEEDE